MLFTWNDDNCELPRLCQNTYSYALRTVLFDEASLFIDPGAGLSQLDFLPDSDFIYDSLFSNSVQLDNQSCHNSSRPESEPPSKHAGPIIRVYGSDTDMYALYCSIYLLPQRLGSGAKLTRNSLNAYYVFIHPYFPVLPPPVSSPVLDRPSLRSRDQQRKGDEGNTSIDHEPSTPITLAISTILALVPHPEDEDPSNPESVLYRRKSAQSFAQSTLESIEIESEILDSESLPSRALTRSSPAARRGPFHPKVPIDIESIIALLILSIYEYAQRGNINKMRTRAGQALVSAMDMSLHSQGDNGGEFAEAKRRAWWMCVSDGVIGQSVERC